MKKLTDNQWRWIVVIGIILLPLFIIHFSSTEIIPRLLSIIVLFVAIPVLLLLALLPNQKPISSASKLKGKYSEKALRKWDLALKIFAAIAALAIIYYATLPLLGGVYQFAFRNGPVKIIEGTIENQQSTLGAAFLYWRFDVKETADRLYFFYPNTIRSTGEKYRFTILPGTNFVLDPEKIN